MRNKSRLKRRLLPGLAARIGARIGCPAAPLPHFVKLSRHNSIRNILDDVVELQNSAQPTIHGALQARRQRAGVLGQETSVEGQELGDIDDRVAGEARRSRRQQDIAWDIGKHQVARDHGHDDSLNVAAVEGVCLDDKDRSPVSRFPAESHPYLPGVLVEGLQLCAMQRGIHFRRPARIHLSGVR